MKSGLSSSLVLRLTSLRSLRVVFSPSSNTQGHSLQRLCFHLLQYFLLSNKRLVLVSENHSMSFDSQHSSNGHVQDSTSSYEIKSYFRIIGIFESNSWYLYGSTMSLFSLGPNLE